MLKIRGHKPHRPSVDPSLCILRRLSPPSLAPVLHYSINVVDLISVTLFNIMRPQACRLCLGLLQSSQSPGGSGVLLRRTLPSIARIGDAVVESKEGT